jgi:multimeric flavodoxin WrbA
MLDVDGVIITTPIYNFHVTGLFKNFIDHFTYWFTDRNFLTKKPGICSRGGMFRSTLKYVIKVAKSWGFDVVDSLVYPIWSVNGKF